MELVCKNCGRLWKGNGPFRCPTCGSLDIRVGPSGSQADRDAWFAAQRRYAELFPHQSRMSQRRYAEPQTFERWQQKMRPDLYPSATRERSKSERKRKRRKLVSVSRRARTRIKLSITTPNDTQITIVGYATKGFLEDILDAHQILEHGVTAYRSALEYEQVYPTTNGGNDNAKERTED